eukprot:scaffold8386_cov79-Skeletonema_marinoi.AAC.1
MASNSLKWPIMVGHESEEASVPRLKFIMAVLASLQRRRWPDEGETLVESGPGGTLASSGHLRRCSMVDTQMKRI